MSSTVYKHELGQMGFFRVVPYVDGQRREPILGHRYPTAYAAEMAARELTAQRARQDALKAGAL